MAVDLSFYKSPLSEEIRAEGRAEGRVRGQADDLLTILDLRGIVVTDQTRERITACDDPELMNQWFHRAVTATSAEGVFAAE